MKVNADDWTRTFHSFPYPFQELDNTNLLFVNNGFQGLHRGQQLWNTVAQTIAAQTQCLNTKVQDVYDMVAGTGIVSKIDQPDTHRQVFGAGSTTGSDRMRNHIHFHLSVGVWCPDYSTKQTFMESHLESSKISLGNETVPIRYETDYKFHYNSQTIPKKPISQGAFPLRFHECLQVRISVFFQHIYYVVFLHMDEKKRKKRREKNEKIYKHMKKKWKNEVKWGKVK